MRLRAFLAAVLLLTLAQSALAQKWPSKIRGYKVYDAKIDLARDGSLKLADWHVAEIGLSGATIEVGAEIISKKQGGKVDFVSFRDFRVNGIAVEVEEYKHPFTFKKGEPFVLPKPARVHLRTANIPRAAYRELTAGNGEMAITGTVFVFGKFKKFGLTFKRVVPIKVELTVANPLASLN